MTAVGAGCAVITGIGLAVSGLRDERDLLPPGLNGGAAGEPGFDLDAAPPGRGMRHKDRASRLALRAASLALRDQSQALTDPDSVAVIVSSNFGNLDTACEFVDTIAAETVSGLSPMRVPHMSSNVTACWVALEHGLRGPNITLSSGTASGLDAMFWAGNLLAARRASMVLVVGVEPDTKPVQRLHRSQGAESWLDGAVCLVVETAQHAAARGARPRALISGYGRAVDRETAEHQASSAVLSQPMGLYVGAAGYYAPALDLTARLGRCSGALGVLQCAAAAAWLDQTDYGSVLAVAGDEEGSPGPSREGDPSGVAALVLNRPTTRDKVG